METVRRNKKEHTKRDGATMKKAVSRWVDYLLTAL